MANEDCDGAYALLFEKGLDELMEHLNIEGAIPDLARSLLQRLLSPDALRRPNLGDILQNDPWLRRG